MATYRNTCQSLIGLILWFAAVFINTSHTGAQALKKPNILVIYTDDHRYSGVHTLGGEAVQTPNLDQLAQEGVAFTNAYLQGAFTGATCIPSRAMLLTGRNLFELGPRQGRVIPSDHHTMGEIFKDAGYYTYHIGKWHNDMKSLARSFDDGAKVSGMPAYLTDQFRMPFSDWNASGNYRKEDCYLLEYDDNGTVIRRALTAEDKRGPIGTEATGPHVSEVLADEAVSFFTNYTKEDPFFTYLAFPTPHDPRQAPQRYKDLYPEEEIDLPPSYGSQHPFDNGHIYLRDERLAPWPRTVDIARQHLSDYYAIITHLDAQIGRVVAALKASGLYENTLIVMAGDSGLGVGNHGLLGKQNIYDEDGIHIPLIFSGGLIEESSSRIDALVYNFDILPTLCELAGLEIPESVTGKSLASVISGESSSVRDYTYHAYRQHQRAVRHGAYKLIEYVRAPVAKSYDREAHIAGSRVTQLFKLTEDPWETFNLADFPEYEEKVKEMRRLMKTAATEFADVPDPMRSETDFWAYYD
ncbi:sulfatase-like hydrolase/transferase [Marinoscillum furvescens]|uniref:Arylsulfatase A-like enzyme n=1 Tax=Marinoscillum furvescens DSM 4134 TaxID=1122208 RepID=A0A3D9L664_MARFU|nr:sulfatase-like hydrolase/transferase [Marinoscillum furvescens]REE00216.1 arylsulfatase A-like enzyme [Marinoscillum furvescens DSM 4134]